MSVPSPDKNIKDLADVVLPGYDNAKKNLKHLFPGGIPKTEDLLDLRENNVKRSNQYYALKEKNDPASAKFRNSAALVKSVDIVVAHEALEKTIKGMLAKGEKIDDENIKNKLIKENTSLEKDIQKTKNLPPPQTAGISKEQAIKNQGEHYGYINQRIHLSKTWQGVNNDIINCIADMQKPKNSSDKAKFDNLRLGLEKVTATASTDLTRRLTQTSQNFTNQTLNQAPAKLSTPQAEAALASGSDNDLLNMVRNRSKAVIERPKETTANATAHSEDEPPPPLEQENDEPPPPPPEPEEDAPSKFKRS